MSNIVPAEIIERKILIIRNQRVMFGKDLAELYNVPTKYLNQQVNRNLERFPGDFMFQLTKEEVKHSRLQFATLNSDRRGKILSICHMSFLSMGLQCFLLC